MHPISFMTANYVARALDYNMTGGWGQGDRASQEFFRPLDTFDMRFAALLTEIRSLGFEAIDLWTGILNPTWATDDHISQARQRLQAAGLLVVSLAGWFGGTPEEFEQTCHLAVALDCRILGGSTSMLQKDRAYTVATLKQHRLVLGLENHPEKSSAELLAKLGDTEGGTLGVCIDTGWFGTQGYDASLAIEELGGTLVHVHLKDVLAQGAHDTCRFGEGIVPLEACVRALQRIGYRGSLSVEHEPEHNNPNEDCRASLAMLKSWLA
jgi:L-ribulose-5-phosphate 3-epimerase